LEEMEISEGRETDVALIELTSDIVSAYVSNNTVSTIDLPNLIGAVHSALGNLGNLAPAIEIEKPKPAVPPRKSVFDDHIICLEDGLKFKTLKRHLRTHHNLSPEEYREKWRLANDYPMVAPAYAQERSKLAREIGLGQKPLAAKRGTRRPRR
jgi:MucR family transcriptional regulator, transcriptional regulator of exopolysaccharide biosynthesis